MRVTTREEATGIIHERDDGGQDQSGSSRNGATGSHSRHTWKVESVRPADWMGAGCKRRGGLWCLRHEEGEGQGLHLLSWGRWYMSV